MTYAEISIKRKAYDISQTKLASYGGFLRALISAWELGKQVPDEEQLMKLNSIMFELMQKIESGDVDLKKKKIQHIGNRKANLPPIMKNRMEYI